MCPGGVNATAVLVSCSPLADLFTIFRFGVVALLCAVTVFLSQLRRRNDEELMTMLAVSLFANIVEIYPFISESI